MKTSEIINQLSELVERYGDTEFEIMLRANDHIVLFTTMQQPNITGSIFGVKTENIIYIEVRKSTLPEHTTANNRISFVKNEY